MLHKMALEIARRLATTEKGQKFLKGVLICALCFFTLIPVAVFAPIAAFVTGIDNFFSGEEGDDLDDTADLHIHLQKDLLLLLSLLQRLPLQPVLPVSY